MIVDTELHGPCLDILQTHHEGLGHPGAVQLCVNPDCELALRSIITDEEPECDEPGHGPLLCPTCDVEIVPDFCTVCLALYPKLEKFQTALEALVTAAEELE